jgi:hypothetical protein
LARLRTKFDAENHQNTAVDQQNCEIATLLRRMDECSESLDEGCGVIVNLDNPTSAMPIKVTISEKALKTNGEPCPRAIISTVGDGQRRVGGFSVPKPERSTRAATDPQAQGRATKVA